MHFLQRRQGILSNFSISCRFAMAGIIARITRSNRERLDKKKSEISTAKSNYTLIPFDDHFVPEVSVIHSYYLYTTLSIMAFPVVEFSREGYKIRKAFG